MPTSRPRPRLLGLPVGLLLTALVAGCAAPSPTPTPSPTATPTPTPSPTPSPSPSAGGLAVSETARAYLVPIAGYDYLALPIATEQQMAAAFAANAAVAAAIRGYAATSVQQGAQTVGVVLVLELDPSITDTEAMMNGFWQGAAGSLNATATTTTLAGTEVREIDAASSKVVGWRAGSLVVLVFGPAMESTAKVAEALISAHA